MSIGWLILTAGLLIGALFFYVLALYLNDRNEDRAAAYEFRHSAPARTFRVALPYTAGGSYRAAPRRTGPQYPLDLPGPANAKPASGPRAGESHVAAPGWGTGRAATRPGAADSGRLTPLPATTSVPGRENPPHAPRPGTTTYDQLLAMATAVNDAWLDRLFGTAA